MSPKIEGYTAKLKKASQMKVVLRGLRRHDGFCAVIRRELRYIHQKR